MMKRARQSTYISQQYISQHPSSRVTGRREEEVNTWKAE
jgi:hypothetical protein